MKSLGFIYLAKRPCGRVSALAWDDPGYEKSTAKHVAEWIARGDKVDRVERFAGDESPEFICSPGCTVCTHELSQNLQEPTS